MAYVLDDSFTQAANGTFNLRAVTQNAEELAHKFTSTVALRIGKVEISMNKSGSPTGNIFAKLYADGATPGTLLSTGTNVDVSTLPGTADYIALPFAGNAQILAAGTSYWIAVAGDWTASDTNFVVVSMSTPDDGGLEINKLVSSTWSVASVDNAMDYKEYYDDTPLGGTSGYTFMSY